MKIIDTHSHYDDSRFDEDRWESLSRQKEAGVAKIINCASDAASWVKQAEILRKLPFVYGALGIHPSNGRDYDDQKEAELRQALMDDRYVAVGEIGLDYYWEDNPARFWQKEILSRQFEIARQVKKPVILHVREAHGDMLEILRKERGLIGVVHSFSGSVEVAKEILDLGYYLGIGGVLTFKNAKALPEVVKMAPLDRLLTETDAPYLTPVPYRGKRNESRHISHVIEAIANIKEMDVDQCAESLYENALACFPLLKKI